MKTNIFINKVIDMVKYYNIDTLLSLDIRYKKKEIRSKQNMNIFINQDQKNIGKK